MVIWGLFLGALLGLFWPGTDGFGLILGALIGLGAGFSLRAAVRSEVATSLAKASTAVATRAPAEAGASASAAVRDPALSTNRSTLNEAQSVDTDRLSAPASSDDALVSAAVRRAAPASAMVAGPVLSTASATPVIPNATRIRPPAPLPNAVDHALAASKAWLLGGNTIVRVGLVILFIGLSFLARYAAVAGLFPVEFRLAAIGAVGLALLGVGFRKRSAKPGFALALQGAGVAVTYLTVFAAFRLYTLLPPLAAFGLMIVVCALSCALALLQNSRALAVAAFAGGFAVPILLSTGQGSHIGLFSYYTVLNMAILFISDRRSWRVLNLVGFVATFGVASAWGALKYSPNHYASAQLFLALFVLIYVFTAVFYARNTPTRIGLNAGGADDSTLVFGTPLAGFALQAGLVQSFELGTALSALAFGALYLVLAAVLRLRKNANYALLVECFIALGAGFATLAVPLGLDARLTSAVWALEGLGAFWVGRRQARWMPRAFGLVLQAVAAFTFLETIYSNIARYPLINAAFLGALLVGLPLMVLAWWLRQSLPHSGSRWAVLYARFEVQLASPAFLVGFGFWCYAWGLEITRQLPAVEVGATPRFVVGESTSQLLMMTALLVSAGLSQRLGLAKRWAVATWPARLSLPVMALFYIAQAASGYCVLQTPAWAVWPLALAVHFWMLRISDGAALAPAALNRRIHTGGAWLVTVLLADALWFWIGRGDLWQTSWASVVMLISAIGVLMVLAGWAGRASVAARLPSFKWPLNPHAAAYYWHAAMPLAALVFGGALVVAAYSPGRTAPLPYIPLLNPTDLTLALSLSALIFWRRVVRSAQPPGTGRAWSSIAGRSALLAVAALAFVMLNTVWLRVTHHFFGVPWDASSLYASFVVQTGYAILWTLLALSLMVVAHRRVQRTLWLTGAGLLGAVVLKLLLVDLSNIGGVERIITFIAVGVLMLVVGYFAPLPPSSPASPSSPRAPAPVAPTRPNDADINTRPQEFANDSPN